MSRNLKKTIKVFMNLFTKPLMRPPGTHNHISKDNIMMILNNLLTVDCGVANFEICCSDSNVFVD
jgi:hypothetical protein